MVAWKPEVIFTPDPVHGGMPTPGLAGRLYLFGPEIDYPLVGDGCVVVDLYDDTPPAAGKALPGCCRRDSSGTIDQASSLPLEEWRLDKATLKRLQRRDAVGWGYTLFLPWGTYKPEITQVQLRLRYEPAKGSPLYAESSPLVLTKDSGPLPPLANRMTKPASNEHFDARTSPKRQPGGPDPSGTSG